LRLPPNIWEKSKKMSALDFCGSFRSDCQFWQEIPVGNDWQKIAALENFILLCKKKKG
jgi:hypothetical protein